MASLVASQNEADAALVAAAIAPASATSTQNVPDAFLIFTNAPALLDSTQLEVDASLWARAGGIYPIVTPAPTSRTLTIDAEVRTLVITA